MQKVTSAFLHFTVHAINQLILLDKFITNFCEYRLQLNCYLSDDNMSAVIGNSEIIKKYILNNLEEINDSLQRDLKSTDNCRTTVTRLLGRIPIFLKENIKISEIDCLAEQE